jgi:peptide/nickel transport system substrate-binding protein
VALEAGDLDWGQISLSSVQRFEDNQDLDVWKKPSMRFRWIALNVQHPKLQDINVRKAIINAIDVPSILQAAYMGEVEQECSLIAPGLIGHWEGATCPKQDLELAQEYMDEAGVESLDLRLDFLDTSEQRTWAEIAQQNLKEIGIDLELNPMETGPYWSTSFGEEACENNELLASSYGMEPDPSWATMWFTCDQIGVWNAQCWCNEEYDRLHEEARQTLDEEARQDMYEEMQRIWEEAAQTVWITHGAHTYAYYPHIEPATTPHGRPQYEFFKPAD